MPRSSSSSNPFHSLASAFPFFSSSSPSPPASASPSPSPAAPHLAVPLLLPVSSGSASASSESRRGPQPLPGARMAGAAAAGRGNKAGGGAGPAFVGQVFTMLDPSGNGLMAVTTRFELPRFLTNRTPMWFKRMLSPLKKSESSPVFRFFMDLNDAVSYVKRLNVPSGMVGACRLDVAYEHFKEKPHLFQFVPNEKQVQAANKLLKSLPQRSRRKKLGGVPVFSAQNLNIAVATNDGIRWYTPYFFDKNLLDNILEASMDQHFHSIMQNRHTQRRRDIVDDSLTSEIIEESAESLLEPPEVQELMNEIGPAGIPLNVVTKAAEIQFLDVVDKVLLGNKWLRKASGIQPKFPYVVDSFEESSLTTSNDENCCQNNQQTQSSGSSVDNSSYRNHNNEDHNHFPFSNLLPNIWPGHDRKFKAQESDNKFSRYDADVKSNLQSNPLLPKITMVGISMGDGAQMSKANLKKTMEDLTKELEQTSEENMFSDDKDPLFVANVGDYSRITKISSA
ncbi:uncharacterized protein LOC8079474 isoform X2 [Sorghum bicolor]|uniref:Uncharacterized protein n=1 Tax=Sorghum bicolor TaxID=4558 RepID=A0A1B6Q0R9_SORBI|nr:uncharacterized protein LOC8079474 isoform X2 [Sorghum bicolor]KXG31523.1 hypothetical protein SORBI_3003G011900 [Sorghum bicolor]|eukprot:XP_021312509.1 uncharacterized protein LOC8079474 isoform X2 [Sorghum bicolor]